MERINEYTKAIEEMIKLKGIEITNEANHKALETGIIDMEMFRAATKVLVAEVMRR